MPSKQQRRLNPRILVHPGCKVSEEAKGDSEIETYQDKDSKLIGIGLYVDEGRMGARGEGRKKKEMR